MRSESAREVVLTKDNAWLPLPNEPVDCYKAFSLYFNSNGTMSQLDIAKELNFSQQNISIWKDEWRWDERTSMYESDLAKGRAKYMGHMELLQAVVVANGFQDYIKMHEVWLEMLQSFIDNPELTLMNAKDKVAAFQQLVKARRDVDELGRNSTLLPKQYGAESADKSKEQHNLKDKPRQMSWGSEGGKLAQKDVDDD